jgi:hypothetical protein
MVFKHPAIRVLETQPETTHSPVARSWNYRRREPCGEWHDRGVNAARTVLRRTEVSASVRGNESSTLRLSAEPCTPLAQDRNRTRKDGSNEHRSRK